jgi:hypothetical protein
MTNATANAGLPDVIEEGEEGTTGDHDQLPPPPSPRDTNGVVKEKLVNVADLEYMKDGGGSGPAAVANGGPKLTRDVMNEHDRRSSSPRPRSSSGGGRDERVAQSYPYLASDNKITETRNGRGGGGVSSVAASAASSSPFNTGTPGGDGDARGFGLASGGTLDTPVMTGQGGGVAAAGPGTGAGAGGVRASAAGHDHAFPFPSCECDGAAIGRR